MRRIMRGRNGAVLHGIESGSVTFGALVLRHMGAGELKRGLVGGLLPRITVDV